MLPSSPPSSWCLENRSRPSSHLGGSASGRLQPRAKTSIWLTQVLCGVFCKNSRDTLSAFEYKILECRLVSGLVLEQCDVQMNQDKCLSIPAPTTTAYTTTTTTTTRTTTNTNYVLCAEITMELQGKYVNFLDVYIFSFVF